MSDKPAEQIVKEKLPNSKLHFNTRGHAKRHGYYISTWVRKPITVHRISEFCDTPSEAWESAAYRLAGSEAQ